MGDAAASLSTLIRDGDPWIGPWRDSVPFRAIVGLVLDELNELQFDSLSRAARECGDQDMLLGDIGFGEEGWPRQEIQNTQRLSLDSYDDYHRAHLDVPRVTNVALWSPSGVWAMVVTTEWFALVGGSELFGARLAATWPPWGRGAAEKPFADQGRMFVTEMARYVGGDRIVPLLSNVFGAEQAARMIEEVTL